MEIAEIKAQLTLARVLQHYGLKPDRNHRLHCPFHPDTTPSLQVYPKTGTVYCFSSNCPLHGKALDVASLQVQELILKPAVLVDGEVDLRNATIGVLRDDPATWPDRLLLDGLTYQALERRENVLYEWNFVRGLKRRMKRKARLRPGVFDLSRLAGIKTVRDFDDAYTAPYFGFAGAEDYYHRASAMRIIRKDMSAVRW